MIKAQTLKGFRDFLPQQAKKRQYVIDTLKKVFESYGFEPLETPALEYEDILLGKYGEEGDKLMYRFEDLGKRKVAMRYDQTVPLARVVTQYQNELPMPFKRYQIQPVWRAENTQKGRFREFLQIDADIVGSSSPLADAEVIACVLECTKKLKFKDAQIWINDRNIFDQYGLKKEEITILDKLEKTSPHSVIDGWIRLGRNNAEEVFNQIKNSEPNERLNQIFKILEDLNYKQGKDFMFVPYLARGLDYYTSTIFELKTIDSAYLLSLAGGGRYDNLIGMFAGRDIPAVGFAFGFDRLIEAMEQNNLFPQDLCTTKVLVTIFSPELKEKSIEITQSLRENKINTEIYLDENAQLEKQLKYANQKGIPYVVVIGPEEQGKNMVTLRNMKTREQKQLSREKMLREISE